MIDVILSTMPFLLEGLWITIKISLITIIFGSLIGAVVGMLPRNRLGRQLAHKLKVYAGPDHPHTAQKPEALPL